MILTRDVRMRIEALAPSRGESTPLEFTGPEGIVRCELSAVDTLGCAIRRLEVEPAKDLVSRDFGLKARSEKLCGKVTYLMEPLALIELDQHRGQAMIRSKQPRVRDNEILYYELLSNASGATSIQRLVYDKSAKARRAVDFVLTPDQFEVLLEDLLSSSHSAD